MFNDANFVWSFSTTDYGSELKRHPSTQQFNETKEATTGLCSIKNGQ